MKSAFEQISLEWDGKTYEIACDMRAIRQVERVMARPEVREDVATNGGLLPTDIAEIFAGLLRYAGADVTDQEVYVGMFRGDNVEQSAAMANAVIAQIMEGTMPPAGLSGEANPPKPAGKKTRSGKKRSRSPSASGG